MFADVRLGKLRYIFKTFQMKKWVGGALNGDNKWLCEFDIVPCCLQIALDISNHV